MDKSIETRIVYSVVIFSALSFFYFGYLYFYPFNEGVSSAPPELKALKDVAYVAMVGMLAALVVGTRKRTPFKRESLIFVPFAIALVVSSVIHGLHGGFESQVRENIKNVVIFTPIFSLAFLLSDDSREELIRKLMTTIVVVAIMQCIFVLLYHGTGGSLWANNVYCGLIGNPNSFGLFLNFAAAVMLSRISRLNMAELCGALVALGLITFVMLRTYSGSQTVIFLVLLVLPFFFRTSFWRRHCWIAVICLIVMAFQQTGLKYVMFTMHGAVRALSAPGMHGEETGASLSVINRVKDVKDTISVLRGDIPTLLLGSFEGDSYRSMDGQFFVFIYNSGLIGFLAFSLGMVFVLIRSFVCAWNTQDETSFALHLILVSFFVTFLASRVLMYFPFNFLFFLLSGLAVAKSFRSVSSQDLFSHIGNGMVFARPTFNRLSVGRAISRTWRGPQSCPQRKANAK